ncbi:hypothetical protein Ga0466249_004822 [Sporomusaceae bacterium BoRhaA]|uniref:hypothetical protein n=1 Tax=Pelorhabdus rhamnosifermentans TaxID=2772457 RepID=UPI001C05F9A9|nr:hypothetical protein [Pelorhabdus rhamnosifermentans]MBU2703674.1 hypothetical protein [Pelorhabdus rhamnosifermentans]
MSSINNFINAVRLANEQKNWYAALGIALMIPDICGRLQNPQKETGKRYIEWFNSYLSTKYSSSLDGDDFYALRCAFLHQGESDIRTQRARKILDKFHFVIPQHNILMHRNKINNTLQLQVDVFCEDICLAAELWEKAMTENNPEVIERSKTLLQLKKPTDSFEGIQIIEIKNQK